MQVIRLLMSNLIRSGRCRPPRRPLFLALGVWVCRLLPRLEELDPCLTHNLAPILEHILEALVVEIIAVVVVADGDCVGGKGGNGAPNRLLVVGG